MVYESASMLRHTYIACLVIKISTCRSRSAQGLHLLENFVSLAAVFALTATVCSVLIQTAGVEKLAVHTCTSTRGLLS